MAAFRRMLQVGIKTENCLMRYRALKAHSTSSSSSSKEFSRKKTLSHPEQEAVDFRDDLERDLDETRKRIDSEFAEIDAILEKMKREARDFYKSKLEAMDKEMRLGDIATVVFAGAVFVVAAVGKSFKKGHGPSPQKEGTVDGNSASVYGSG